LFELVRSSWIKRVNRAKFLLSSYSNKLQGNSNKGAICMYSKPHRAAATLSATLIASLAAMPTASALAGSGFSSGTGTGAVASASSRGSHHIRALTAPGELLPPSQLEKLLSGLPLKDLNATQLAHYLAGLEGIGALATLHHGLLGKELGAAGLEQGLTEAIEQLKLGNSSATLGELANAKEMLPALEGKLGGLLKTLLGSLLSTEQSESLEHALNTVDLQQLVGSLLSSTTPKEQLATELSTLAGGLFGELGAEDQLESLLGSLPTGSFAPKSVKEVSEELGTTPKVVSEELGQTTATLPETATMLTAPLTKGKLAGIAPAAKGLALGILGAGSEALEGEGHGRGGEGEGSGEGKGSGENNGSGENKGSGEDKGSGEGNGSGSGEGTGKGTGTGDGSGGSGSGGLGGPGGTGSGGGGGTTTVLLTLPSTPSSSTQSAAAATKRAALPKVAILSHTVKGSVAAITLRVPSAGTIALAGRDIRTVSRQTAKAERLTLRARLSPAGVASLRSSRGRRRLALKLTASFKPAAGGSGSSAAVTVSFA
jgi:hypothetical protein